MDRSAMTVGPGMDMPIMHDSDRYDLMRDIGSGNFGVARLMRDKVTKELVAVKYIERGDKIDGNVQREIINHRSLRHPNIVRFKELEESFLSEFARMGDSARMRLGSSFNNLYLASAIVMPCKYVTVT